jgi:photosystem II stability/assembly factor-like uncharacterized protein
MVLAAQADAPVARADQFAPFGRSLLESWVTGRPQILRRATDDTSGWNRKQRGEALSI